MSNYGKSWIMLGKTFSLVLAVALAGCGPSEETWPVVKPATSSEIVAAVKAPGAKAVLVNMWASWCPPCREEFPDLVKLQKNYRERGLRVVFVSWDNNARPAARFLAKQGVTESSFIKSSAEGDQKFLERLQPELTGAIPATLIYDATGKLRSFWEGAVSYEEFEKKVQEAFNR